MRVSSSFPFGVMSCALAATVVLSTTGCFKSLTIEASSESSSNSISSPFESSSNSSSPEEEEADEVSSATTLWAQRGEDVDTLRRDIGRITAAHGVSDWEQHPATYRAIGVGLRRSELRRSSLESVKNAFATGHPQALTWINAGYYTQIN